MRSKKSDTVNLLAIFPLLICAPLFIAEGKVPRDKTTRVLEFLVVPSWLYILMCSLSSLGILIALGFLIFNIYYRNKR